jgi:uncharacterized protein|tara:strand:- start:1439 stop:1813 length:375 start_codon:yes stop_codon:yes gene_type:complete
MDDYLLYILIGAFSGLSVGLVGIGTGLITVPLLIYFGIDLRQAVGLTLLMHVIPQTLPGLILYHNKGFIDYYVSFYVILGSLFGTALGSYLIVNEYISERLTYQILTVIISIASIIFIDKYFLH